MQLPIHEKNWQALHLPNHRMGPVCKGMYLHHAARTPSGPLFFHPEQKGWIR
jgi:hypothetical protein